MLSKILNTNSQSALSSFKLTLQEADRRYLIDSNLSLKVEKSGQLPLYSSSGNAILYGLNVENPFIAFLRANKSNQETSLGNNHYSPYFGITVLQPTQSEGLDVLRERSKQEFIASFLKLASNIQNLEVLKLTKEYVRRISKRLDGNIRQTEVQIKKHPNLLSLAVNDLYGMNGGLTTANLEEFTTTSLVQITPYTLLENPQDPIDFTKPPINTNVLNARVYFFNRNEKVVNIGTLNASGDYQSDWTEVGKTNLKQLLEHSNGWLSAFLPLRFNN